MSWEQAEKLRKENIVETDAPLCTNCGTLMQRSGSCHTCPECGQTSGCA